MERKQVDVSQPVKGARRSQACQVTKKGSENDLNYKKDTFSPNTSLQHCVWRRLHASLCSRGICLMGAGDCLDSLAQHTAMTQKPPTLLSVPWGARWAPSALSTSPGHTTKTRPFTKHQAVWGVRQGAKLWTVGVIFPATLLWCPRRLHPQQGGGQSYIRKPKIPVCAKEEKGSSLHFSARWTQPGDRRQGPQKKPRIPWYSKNDPSTEGNWGRNKALSGEEGQAHCCERYFSWVVKGMRGRWFGQPRWLWPLQEICLCQEGAAVSRRGCHHGLGPMIWHLQQVGRSFRFKLKNIHHSQGETPEKPIPREFSHWKRRLEKQLIQKETKKVPGVVLVQY